MKNLLLFLLGCLPVLVWGQFGPQNVITECQVCSPKDIHSADLDGDGDFDILFASNGPDGKDKIAWYNNQGNGQFSQQIVISDQVIILESIHAADLDQDGNLDVLSASRDDKIAWYKNEGDGQFSQQIIISDQADGAYSVYTADLDQDGDIDVLSASALDGKIAWYNNQGNGQFSQQIVISNQALGAESVYAADLDQDGDIDVLSASNGPNNDNKVAWYRNEGNGQFSEQMVISSQVITPEAVHAADLDQDGDLDVLSASRGDNKVVWYKNEGNGQFSQKITISNQDIGASDVYTTDLDQDGDLDVIVGAGRDDKLIWYENDGDANFLQRSIISDKVNGINAVHTADLDQDGDLDVLSASAWDDKIAWYKNSGTGQFTQQIIISPPTASNAESVYAADLDQDGDLDVLSASSGDNKIAWYKNNGNRQFSQQIIISDQAENAKSVYAADLDQDGDLDVLSASRGDNKIAWYKNNGTGQFSQEIIISTQVYTTTFVYAVDLDQDGDLDVLTASDVLYAQEIIWYKNNGTGQFTQQIISTQSSDAISVYAVDLDQDGDLDVLSASEWSNQIAWYENNGIGQFSQQIIISNQVDDAKSVYAADLDRDGDLDVLATSDGDDKIAWYENDGSEQFSQPKIISTQVNDIESIYTADLDHDGDLDVLAASDGDDRIAWYENDGSGQFSQPKIISAQVNDVKYVYAADLDQDGDLDVLSTSYRKDKIAWYENFIDLPVIVGTSFWDINTNGLFENNEPILENVQVQIFPNPQSSYTNSEGIYRFYLADGTYTITPQTDNCWQLTTDSSSYTVTIDGNTATELNFGFQLANDYQHTQAHINSNPTRCGFEVPFTLSVANDGCVPSQGQYGIVLDDLVTLISTEIEPNEVRGDTLLWNYTELIASQNDRVRLTLEIAGADFIGDTIQLTGLSYIENEQGTLELSSTYDFTSEIRCAYDPNDKLVYPNRAGEYDANYTLFEEQLEYTVRFQNTGNDTAFTVIIRDELDKNLDWTTFKPVLASHPHETLLHADGLVEFTFRDILLPDSTTNEPLSHGFVTYRISPKADLEEGTIIENTANIFFDFNPPIQTNITKNVLVSELPKPTSTKQVSISEEVQVYPNPFADSLTFEMEKSGNYQLMIFDALGKLIEQYVVQDARSVISTKQWMSGIYFYQAHTPEKVIANGKLVKVGH